MKTFFQKLFSFLFRRKDQYKPVFTGELPRYIREDRVYIQVNEGYAWQIVFTCPCGCKTDLYVNLLEEMKPCWRYQIDKEERITLSPSIDRKEGCKSHFFLKAGKIIWV